MVESVAQAKACTRRGEIKPLDLYFRCKRVRDGRMSHCKACSEKCAWAIANRCPVSVTCVHGEDTCPICDYCTCTWRHAFDGRVMEHVRR